MSRRKLAVVAVVVILVLLPIAWFVSTRIAEASQPAFPSKANFDRLRLGMTLAEAEAILGPAGFNLSSDTSRDYYLWRGEDGWSRIWLEDCPNFWSKLGLRKWVNQAAPERRAITKLDFDPEPHVLRLPGHPPVLVD